LPVRLSIRIRLCGAAGLTISDAFRMMLMRTAVAPFRSIPW
jgi:antitoxin component of RelBE/YafQ-DinJ toxin-antitoxin module